MAETTLERELFAPGEGERRNVPVSAALREFIRANPTRWVLVRNYDTDGAARGLAYRQKTGHWDAVARPNKDGTWGVWMRYVGPIQ